MHFGSSSLLVSKVANEFGAYIACVASVSVRFRTKRGRPKREIPFLGLSLLQNRTETVATKANAYTSKWMDKKVFGWLFPWVGGWLYAWLCVRINSYRRRPSRPMRTASAGTLPLSLDLIFMSLCHRSPTGPLPFSKFLRVLKPCENLVHLSRATVQHVVCF